MGRKSGNETQRVVWVLVMTLLTVLWMGEATPPGIANNPSQARCLDDKYKTCYNLVHVCPKFCPNGCTVNCQSCKPVCIDGESTPPPPDSASGEPVPPPVPIVASSPPPPQIITPSPSPPPPPISTPSSSPPSPPPPAPIPVTPTSPPPPSPAPVPITPTSPPPVSTPSTSPSSSPSPAPVFIVSPPPPPSEPVLAPSSSPSPPPPVSTPTSSPAPVSTPNSSPSPLSPISTPSMSPLPAPASSPSSSSSPPPTLSTPPPSLSPVPSTPSPTPSPPPNENQSPPPSSSSPPQSSPPANNTTPPPTWTPYPPPPGDSEEAAGARRMRCKNKNYPDCYGRLHVCPSSCPHTCEVDCVSCKPVCSCDMPGAVCQDPRFIGADGITFYFHGKKDKDFCLVSDPNLHINAHFIGKRNENMKRDFTWVQSIAVLFGHHRLFLGARETTTWNDAVDRLSLSFDGEPIFLNPTDGTSWQSDSLPSAAVRRDGAANGVTVEVAGLFKISAKVVPITQRESRVHNYGITADDCFAHLELAFKFYSLSGKVNGVLGHTYGEGYESRVKMGVAMPVMGGERKFAVSELFATDCKVSQFEGGEQVLSAAAAAGLELASMKCGSGIGGRGVVCKR